MSQFSLKTHPLQCLALFVEEQQWLREAVLRNSQVHGVETSRPANNAGHSVRDKDVALGSIGDKEGVVVDAAIYMCAVLELDYALAGRDRILRESGSSGRGEEDNELGKLHHGSDSALMLSAVGREKVSLIYPALDAVHLPLHGCWL